MACCKTTGCCQGQRQCDARACCKQVPACAKRHVLLVGFMGAGKSTVARKLARRCGMMSLDTDIFIARETGMSTSDLFKLEGEKAFRQRECEVLERLSAFDPCIISCGGGIVLGTASRAALRRLGTVVYFKVNPEEAVARISHPETRPLLAGDKSPAELLEERSAYYEEVADIVIEVSGLSSSVVAFRLAEILKEKGII